jgi:hypothetical protein
MSKVVVEDYLPTLGNDTSFGSNDTVYAQHSHAQIKPHTYSHRAVTLASIHCGILWYISMVRIDSFFLIITRSYFLCLFETHMKRGLAPFLFSL